MRIRTFVLLSCLCALAHLMAQDTLRISLYQADSLLQARSLALLEGQLGIDKAEADRVQAKLFNNPQFSSSWVVGGSSLPYLDIGANGEKVVAVEQLFRIAGQRSLAVKAATERKHVSEAEFSELAASLRLQLHTAFFQQYFAQRSATAIASQLGLLKNLQAAYGDQYEKGNVSLKDATRLRTAFFALNQQRITLLQQINGLQEQMRNLLVESRPVTADPTAAELVMPTSSMYTPDSLVALAQRQRPTALAAQAALDASTLDLKLQRRMAVPDLAIGAEYDQQGNLHPQQTSVTLGFSIPLFDRNQGRIKWAEAAQKEADADVRLNKLAIGNEVRKALGNIAVLQEQLDATNPGFDTQLDQLSESLVTNYVKNNIQLVEFTDLFDSYNTTIIALNQLKADLQSAYEQLEFATGQRLFNR